MQWKWWKKQSTPAVNVVAHPVSLNSTPGEREQRNMARIALLRKIIADGDTRQSVKDELERRERWGR